MTRSFILCLLFLIPFDASGAQGVVPNTWSARSNTGLTFVGTWTAIPGPTSETVTGTWTLVNAQGATVAGGGWSASKSPDAWIGNWRAANFGSDHEFTGSWKTSVDLKGNAAFAAIFEKAAQAIVSGSWRAGSYSGAWSIRAQVADKTTPPTRNPDKRNPGKSEMEPLLTAYRAGHSPEEREMVGRWLLVKEIDTERFLTGKAGPDHVLFDERGVRDTTSGNRYMWELTVSRDFKGRLIGASRTTSRGPEISRFLLSAREITFDKDSGSGTRYYYRCRVSAADRLICIIDKPNPGHAVEFRKMN